MRREDWPILAVILEAVDIIVGIAYFVLQIYYGYLYHISPIRVIMNILVVILVYAGLTLLAAYPERINNLPPEVCTGKVRRLSLWMVRLEKLLFLASLLAPCIFDVLGVTLPAGYSVAVILVMLLAAVSFEIWIIQIIRKDR